MADGEKQYRVILSVENDGRVKAAVMQEHIPGIVRASVAAAHAQTVDRWQWGGWRF